MTRVTPTLVIGSLSRAARLSWNKTGCWAMFLGVLLLFGCGASTDTGNPPVVQEQRIMITPTDDGVSVSAEAGAVSPGGAEIEVTNVSTGESRTTTAASDGSFEIDIPGDIDDDYRVVVRSDGGTTRVDVSAGSGSTAALVGREFLLQSSEGYSPVEDTTIRLSFDADGFGFSAGCNSFFGSYSLCDGRLCASGLGSTEIGCAPALHQQDEWLVDFLTSTPELTLDADRLTLTGTDATLTFLDREVADPDRPLTGRTWTIDTLIQGGAASNIPTMNEPTLMFSDSGQLQVYTSCANGTGSFEIADQELILGDVAYDDEVCDPSGSEAAHSLIMSVVRAGMVSYEIDAARLTLMRGDQGLGAITD